jgi:hypothetical protein
MNPKRSRGVACSALLGQLLPKSGVISISRLRYYALRLRFECLILFHKALYCFYLLRKRLVLPFYIRRTRLSLLNAERHLVAKHGRDWRLCVFDDQVVQFLKLRDDIHARSWWPNDTSSDAPDPRRPE